MRIIYHGVEPDALLEHIIGFYHASPRLVYGAVFLISLSESLALAGLLVLQKNDVYLLAGGGGLIYGLKYNNSKSRPLTIDRFNTLVKRYFGRIAAVFNFQKYQSLKGKIPKQLFLETNIKNISDIMPKDGFVFAKY